MHELSGRQSRRGRLPFAFSVRDWELWSLPALGRSYYLVTDVAAVVAIIVGLRFSSVSAHSTITMVDAGTILAAAVIQGEISRRVESFRKLLSGSVAVNMTSVWIFAAVILLPFGWAGVLVVLIHLHLWYRSWHKVLSAKLYRIVNSAAAMVFAALAARLVMDSLPTDTAVLGWISVGKILLAGAAFFLVESLLVGVLVGLAKRQQSLRDLAGEWNDNVLEIATICLGMMTAFVVQAHPALVVLVFLPLVILHRVGLVKQLETLAATDQKTGLLTAGAWQHTAIKELNRARGVDNVGVLMIDLDHFKRINDAYGHIAGDAVLQAVAAVVKAATRDYDIVGRFGGEEFVVLLPRMTPSGAVAAAERIRRAIEVMSVEAPGNSGTVTIEGLSASIGVAVYPLAGRTVDEVLLAADNAAYEAKGHGRNLVVTWDSLVSAG